MPTQAKHPASQPAARPTISDIARAAGVSTTVVSYALNGRAGVSAATRERVLRVADEFGWRPSAAARSVRSGSRVVGLAVSSEPSSIARAPSFLEFVTAVNHVTAGRRLELTIQITEPDVAANTYRDWWAERRFGVMIVPDPITADPRVEVLSRTRAPAVVLGPQEGANGLASVSFDEREAARSLAKYLVELGHRTVAVVTAPERLQRTVARVEALRKMLAERGSSLVHRATEATPEEAAVVTRDLLAGPRRPSAIVYDTDQMTIAGLDVARRSGLRVPWDLSIVSCSDSALCRLATPTITTLPTPMCELGLSVGHAALAVLDGGVDITTVVPIGGLVVRGSTGPPTAGVFGGKPALSGVLRNRRAFVTGGLVSSRIGYGEVVSAG